MTATDELRRLLDERGVKWKAFKPNPWVDTTSWDIDLSDPRREVEAGYSEYEDGVTLMRFWNATPEQAIAATLGDTDATPTRQGDAGTCHDKGNIERFICSECGCRLDLQDDDWEPTMWLDDGAAMVPRFCPNCGRRCVG